MQKDEYCIISSIMLEIHDIGHFYMAWLNPKQHQTQSSNTEIEIITQLTYLCKIKAIEPQK